MTYRVITFKTTDEAYWFKRFLGMKAIPYAKNSETHSVTIKDIISDQTMFDLAVMFGKWL